MALQIRRGLQTSLPGTPADGELLYATDTGNLYIGVSGTPTIVNSGGGGGATAISDLSDVTSISGITNGQALLWNSGTSKFVAGNIPAGYADADVQTFLGGSLAGHIIPATDVTYDLGSATYKFRDLYLSGTTITLGTKTISVTGGGDLNISGTTIPNASSGNLATEAYVTTSISNIVDSAPGALNTLNELAAALGDDANYATTTTNAIALKADTSALSTVATSGLFADLSTRPAIALSGNNLTYDGTTIDLTSVGATGATGAAGATGDAGAAGAQGTQGIQGPQGDTGTTGSAGAAGAAGADGTSISSGAVSSGTLTLTMSDASTVTVSGSVNGATGAAGTNGVGITGTALVGDNLTLTYSNTSVQDVGSVRGPTGTTGAAGNDGLSISSGSVSGGTLTLVNSDSSTITVTGNIAGAVGADGATGSAGPTGSAGANGSNGTDGNDGAAGAAGATGPAGAAGAGLGDVSVTTASAGSAALAYNSGTGVLTFTPPDLSSYLTSETDSQTLSLSGTDLTISGGNTLDVSSLGGSSYNNASVDTHLNQASAATSEVLSWNGSDYDWVAQSGGTSTLLGLTDVGSDGTSGQALTTDGAGNFTFASVGSGGTQNVFSNFAVTGQNTIIAESTTDTLTIAAGSGVTLTTDSGTDTLTIAASGGGGGGASIERFKLNYASNGNLDSITDDTSGISGVTIDSTTSGECSVTFTGYNYPPASIMIYGYDYANNKYYISNVETTMGTREIAGGGSSGSPVAFGGSATPVIKIKLREAETGASRSFGTTTHAWIQMVLHG
jgi:collagen type VII alpha